MNINSIYRNITSATNSKNFEKFKADIEKADEITENSTSADVVDFSPEALKFKEKLTSATQVNSYSVKKGINGGYNVRFSNSAQIAKAVANGFIDIDGERLILSDDDKKALIKTDKLAQEEREKAYAKTVIEHDIKVMKQQKESFVVGEIENDIDVFSTAMKVFSGEYVSKESLDNLREFNPELYTVAKLTAVLSKQQDQINNMKISGLMADESNSIKNTLAQEAFNKFGVEVTLNVNDGDLEIADIFIGEE